MHADELPRRHNSTVKGCIQLPAPPLEPSVPSPAAHKYTSWCLSLHMAPGLISGRSGPACRSSPAVFVYACTKTTTADRVDTSHCLYEDTVTLNWLAHGLELRTEVLKLCLFYGPRAPPFPPTRSFFFDAPQTCLQRRRLGLAWCRYGKLGRAGGSPAACVFTTTNCVLLIFRYLLRVVKFTDQASWKSTI